MKTIRIGNACGFWGDSPDAPLTLTRSGQLNYLTLEYLAELTMSILALRKQKNPLAGYATDFPQILAGLLPELIAQPNLKIITNAGGMNPEACASTCRKILDTGGLTQRKIGIVSGDDLMPRLAELLDAGHELKNLETGEPLRSLGNRVVSANAYLGAFPIAEALSRNCSLVITGRVADASLTVAPAIHEFGWNAPDLLCSATIAGHLIECGAQVTGGLWCRWEENPDFAGIGYPIAEMDATGTFRICKPSGTGGRINLETVTEQLLYEVSDPSAYLTPDVVADLTTVSLKQLSPDVVEISGARGKPATDFYKVSIAYRDGFMSAGTLVLAGPDAVSKARRSGEMLLERLRRSGLEYARSNIEVLGSGDLLPGVLPRAEDPPEVVLRVAVHDPREAAVERFTREFAPLVTSGPPGVTGYTSGRPPVREVFAYWPALIAKIAVKPSVQVI